MSGTPGERVKSGLEIAVVGMAGRFPGARDIDEFWEILKDGRETLSFPAEKELEEAGIPPGLMTNPNYVKTRGGIVEDKDLFDAHFFCYTPEEAELVNPQTRLFLECSWAALEDAGLNPDSYDGVVGIYAGALQNFDWDVRVLLSGKADDIGEFSASKLSGIRYLCTRISYNLNLNGPSITIQTACSTSLVAIHLACQAILGGECDVALAGGVSISTTDKNGHLYQEGLLFSADGHCRPFDEQATGTLFGDGMGIVVLKSLEDAIAEGDNIHAVIKGSAVNNDGGERIGFTAPGINGQIDVIRTALQVADVEPESIGYIEAHGAGTILGDPIEIEALTRAFNTSKKRFCKIGSVKSNVGHLDTAAGIAGLIKTVLALKNKVIPPHLHFQRPNPKIDFENSPFYVNTQLSQWQRGKHPLRAGVSSMGIGGTNAHIILEEAPEVESSSESRKPYMILLSAKSEPALDRATKNLAAYLRKNPRVDLANCAYTLQVGRKVFPYRKLVINSNIQKAISALESQNARKPHTFVVKGDKPMIFMFPGVGSQYVNMGLELYQKEDFFRSQLDVGFQLLLKMSYDLKPVLYPVGNLEGVKQKIKQANINQPIIFIFEYALARLLIHWGLKPDAMIGYSLGEYVAACISGVFSLEDALKLVVIRSQLVRQLPPGAMLSVPIPAEELQKLLPNELSLAIDNGPSCIVAGPVKAVDEFENKMKQKRCLCMPVHTYHAIHSQMMDPILKEFEKKVGQIQLKSPQIPYISNLTGQWITAEEAKYPGYWSKHLRCTVQFSNGIKKMINEGNSIFIEIGPGRDLSALIMRHIENKPGHHVINLIGPPENEVSSLFYLINRIGRLWLYGKNIDWAVFYSREKRRIVSLPTYPFERQRYWIEHTVLGNGTRMSAEKPSEVKKTNISDWFYIPTWRRCASLPASKPETIRKSNWLFFEDECGLAPGIARQMTEEGGNVIIVKKGTEFSRMSDRLFFLNPRKNDGFDQLFHELQQQNKIPHKIVYMWGVTDDTDNSAHTLDIEGFNRNGITEYRDLLDIVRWIGSWDNKSDIQFNLVTNNMQEVIGQEDLRPEKATLYGVYMVMAQQYPWIKCSSIDILLDEFHVKWKRRLIDNLIAEFSEDSSGKVVSYRGNHRWVREFEPLTLDKPEKLPKRLKEKGVYLITGGLEGIGFELAKYLLQVAKARLALVEDENASEITEVENKMRKLKELQAYTGEVLDFNVTIANPQQMQKVISEVKNRFGAINGVIHCADIFNPQLMTREKSPKRVRNIFIPKVEGLLMLESILKDTKLDFFILSSSLISVHGQSDQVDFCAANAFLDAFAHYKVLRDDTFTISINWDWQINTPDQAREYREQPQQISPSIIGNKLSPEEGVEAFTHLLDCIYPQVVVSPGGPMAQLEQSKISKPLRSQDVSKDSFSSGNESLRPVLGTPYIEPANELEQILVEIWGKFFGIQQLGTRDDFFELGGDSLKALNLVSRIHKELNVEILPSEIFKNPTVEKIVKYINSLKKDTFESIQPVEKKEHYELSFAQKSLYIQQQVETDNLSYNLPIAVILEGHTDKDRLGEVFGKLIERQEILRTSFEFIGKAPAQRVHKNLEWGIEYFEASEAEVDNIIKGFLRPFNLKKAPLLRVGLIKIEETKHILIADMHHIIKDAASMDILIREFTMLYAGQDLPPLRIQYNDYRAWLNRTPMKDLVKKQEEYWLSIFSKKVRILDLPIDFSRDSGLQNLDGEQVSFTLDEEITGRLKKMVSEKGVTLYMVLLAAYTILLSIYTRQEDIVVGTPVSGRTHIDLDSIIGMFVNMLPMRNYPVRNKTFTDFLEEVKENSLNAFDNQHYPFGMLINKLKLDRNLKRNPLFDTTLLVQKVENENTEIEDLTIIPYRFSSIPTPFELVWEIMETKDRVYFNLRYSKNLYKKETVERLWEHYRDVLNIVSLNHLMKLSDIELFSENHHKDMEFPEIGRHLKREIVFDF